MMHNFETKNKNFFSPQKFQSIRQFAEKECLSTVDQNGYRYVTADNRLFRVVQTERTKIRPAKGENSVPKPERSMLGVIQSGNQQVSELRTEILRSSYHRHTRYVGGGRGVAVSDR